MERIADIWTTKSGLERGLTEGNPIFAWLFGNLGLFWSFLIGMVYLIVLILLMEYFIKDDMLKACLYGVIVGILTLPIINNVFLLVTL